MNSLCNAFGDNEMLWIILLLIFLGGFGNNNCGNVCGGFDDNIWLIIIILFFFCGNGCQTSNNNCAC